MSERDSVTGEEVEQILGNLDAIMNGDVETSSEAIEEAKEPGLNPQQQAVAEKYAGEGTVTVDDSTTPNLADKLIAGAELPWTFVLDGVQFVMKAGYGSGRNPSSWGWYEDGYSFDYMKYDDRENKVRIVDRDD